LTTLRIPSRYFLVGTTQIGFNPAIGAPAQLAGAAGVVLYNNPQDR
jgi:hypothetical protein